MNDTPKPFPFDVILEDSQGRVYFICSVNKAYDYPVPSADLSECNMHENLMTGERTLVIKSKSPGLVLRSYPKPPEERGWKW